MYCRIGTVPCDAMTIAGTGLASPTSISSLFVPTRIHALEHFLIHPVSASSIFPDQDRVPSLDFKASKPSSANQVPGLLM